MYLCYRLFYIINIYNISAEYTIVCNIYLWYIYYATTPRQVQKGGVHNESTWFFYCFRCGKHSSILYLQMAERR